MFGKCCNNQMPMNNGMGPIIEPTINTCIEKDFYCEVPQE